MEWEMMSTVDQAKVVGLNEKVIAHPDFTALKKRIDRKYRSFFRYKWERHDYEVDSRYQWRYLHAQPYQKRNSEITLLQRKIAEDCGIRLGIDEGKFKGTTFYIPKPEGFVE